ncbi:MFS transporter [Nocardioides sp. W7]|uniref:MFS transporter n=1 Tax=Nocardioides sp. W7 TaxID=2931390 RepID=UPI001FD3C55F|nr:MFS transporter [Nocardioides sp. W7]
MSDRLRFHGLVLVALATGIAVSLAAPLVPMIAREEGVALATAQWALTGSFLVAGVMAPLLGRLGVGRRLRPTLIVTLGLGVLGALLAALPLGIWGILAGRALQGFPYAVAPLLFAVARNVLPEDRIAGGLSTLSVANVAAAGLGFPLVSFVAMVAGLEGALWFGFALMVVALVVGVVVVPPSAVIAPGGLDLVGALLLGGGTFAVLLAVSRGGLWGYASPRTLVVAGVGVLLVLMALRWFGRVAAPLIDFRLARLPVVLGAHLTAVLAGIGMYVLLTCVLVIAQSPPGEGYGLGRSVAVAGLMLTPYSALSVVGNRIALRAGHRVGPERLIPIGCLLYTTALLSLWHWHANPWQLVLAMSVGGIASGVTFNAIPWLVVRAVPNEETASVMSVNLVLRFVGFAMGSAVAVAFLSAFGGSATSPSRLGFETATLVGAGICLVASLVAALLMSRPARSGEPTPGDGESLLR